MTVYVDNAGIEATVPNGSISHTSQWCHLTADTKDELHAFAVGKLKLRRSYFQDKPRGLWHYDLTEGKRRQAVRLGAVETTYGDLDEFERIWRRPGREGLPTPKESITDPPITDPPITGVDRQRNTMHTETQDTARRRPEAIESFTGQHRWLSNFAEQTAFYDGVAYPTREHAFAAAKTTDLHERVRIIAAGSPGDAKRLGRDVTLRSQWDKVIRYEAMTQIVASTFAPDSEPALKLLAADDDLLVEGNTHHDQLWGCCRCEQHAAWPGQNRLGITLMARRTELRALAEGGTIGGLAPADRWTRVMATGHRPQYMSADQVKWMRSELARVAAKLISDHGMRVAIHGGAIGADLAWAEEVDVAGVEALWAYLPFPQQSKPWTPSQIETWKTYSNLRGDLPGGIDGGQATRSGFLGDHFDVRTLHARNEWMIRDAEAVVAVVDSTKTTGGTVSALKKIGTSLPVIRLDIHTLTVKIAQARR